MKTTKPLYIAIGMVLGAAVLALIAAAPNPGVLNVPGIIVRTNGTEIALITSTPGVGQQIKVYSGAANQAQLFVDGSQSYLSLVSGSGSSTAFLKALDGVGNSAFQLQSGAGLFNLEPNTPLADIALNLSAIGPTTNYLIWASLNANPQFAVKSASGWTGTGVNALMDDGTYKAVVGGSAVWTNSPTGTASLVTGVTNVEVPGLSVSGTAPSYFTNGVQDATITSKVVMANATNRYQAVTGIGAIKDNGAQAAAADLSNGTSGTGAVALTNAPTLQASTNINSLTMTGTNGLLNLISLTTAQKTNQSAVAGSLVYDSTLGRVQAYDGSAWHSRVRLEGDTMTAGGLTNRFDGFVGNGAGLTNLTLPSTIGAFGATTLAATATVSLPIVMPYTGHITGWSISADGTSPTVTFDVLKEAAGGTAIPSVSIMGTKPALAAGNVVHSTAVSDWTTNFNAGDIFMIKVDTGNIVSTAVQLTLETLR